MLFRFLHLSFLHVFWIVPIGCYVLRFIRTPQPNLSLAMPRWLISFDFHPKTFLNRAINTEVKIILYILSCSWLQSIKKSCLIFPGWFASQAPHPLYQPSNDLVACTDPLCLALHSPDTPRCENPKQCDYVVEYADGGSSLGVLVKDAFALNYRNGVQIKPHLALGLLNFSKLFFCITHPSYFFFANIAFRIMFMESFHWKKST